MKFNKNILLLAVVSLPLLSIAGGGWTLKKNESYIKLSEWWIVSDQHFVEGTLKDPNSTIGVFNTAVYAEYGFSNRFTGIIYAPFFSRSVVNNQVSSITGDVLVPGDGVSSVGDFDLGLKYGIFQKTKIKLAATINFGLAFGVTNAGNGGNLQTGDGEYNQLLRLDAGYGFQIKKTPFYTNIYTAVNNRTEGFSDEIRFGGEIGIGLAQRRWWLVGKLFGTQSFQNGSLDGANSTGIFANNTEFLSYAIGTNYKFTEVFGVSGELSIPISGEITSANPSYSLGLFWDLKQGRKKKETTTEPEKTYHY